MDLERVTTELRPRGNWEAMDLGLSLYQANVLMLFATWFTVTLPVIIICSFIIVVYNNDFLAIFIFWLGKPLYDRALLHFLSRSLFGEQATFKEIIKRAPRAMFTAGAFTAITFLRLHPSRSFALPMRQLEGLAGRKLRDRSNVLRRVAGSTPTWLTIICVHLASAFYSSLIILVFMFLPPDYFDRVFELVFAESPVWWISLCFFLAYFLAETIIEPLYVTSGFSLYINCRTVLEAWDIEVMFRRLVVRHKSLLGMAATVVVALGMGFVGLITPESAFASEISGNATSPILANMSHLI